MVAVSNWDFVAMGQAAVPAFVGRRARRAARLIGSWTGSSEGTVLALFGAGFFAVAAISLLRTGHAMYAAGLPRSRSAALPSSGGQPHG